MGDVPTTTLEEMCEFVIDCPHFTPEWNDSGYIVIRNQNIKNGQLDLSNPSFTHEDDFKRRIHRAKPQKGDIIFTREAPMGEVCIVPKGIECCLGQRQVLLRPKTTVDGRYLFFALRSPYVRHQIFWNEGTGSTVSNVRIPVLKALRIPRMGRAESCIGLLLGALDDKIELNRRTNETLEAMARALFRDWFVDFGPTRAKMEGRDPYLAPDLWALFPDRLDDATGLPEGWRNYTLNELADHHRATVSPGAAPDTIFEHYSIPAHDAGNEPTLDLGESIKSNKTVVPDGAILLSKLNPEIERVWLPNPKGDAPQVASTEFLAFTPIQSSTRGIVYCLFRSERFRGEMAALVTGTSKSHQRVSPKALLSREVFVGDPKLLPVFDDVCGPLVDQMLANRREARTLACTRDVLLPKLMSGEIRLRDAEKIAEEAAA